MSLCYEFMLSLVNNDFKVAQAILKAGKLIEVTNLIQESSFLS